jgi:integrase
VADLEATGRSGKYIHDLKKRVLRLMRECGWTQLQDVTSNSFLSWRVKQKLAPKTVNEYLTSLRSLLNWMKMHGRIERDPMRNVQKVQSNGNQVYARRAFTRQEIQRLLASARRVIGVLDNLVVFFGWICLHTILLKRLKIDISHDVKFLEFPSNLQISLYNCGAFWSSTASESVPDEGQALG